MQYSIQTYTETIADIEYDVAMVYLTDCQVEFTGKDAFIKAKQYVKLLNEVNNG